MEQGLEAVEQDKQDIAKLAAKLVKVVQAVGYVQKTGHNRQQNYSYVTEADLADKFRAAMIAAGLALIPNLSSRTDKEITSKQGTIGTFTTVVMEYTLIDSETGCRASFRMGGDGMDYGDKALYKAITGAKKYAMKELAVISTGDDPERDEAEAGKAKSPTTIAALLKPAQAVTSTVNHQESKPADAATPAPAEVPASTSCREQEPPPHDDAHAEQFEDIIDHNIEREDASNERVAYWGEYIGAAKSFREMTQAIQAAEDEHKKPDSRLSATGIKALRDQYWHRKDAMGWLTKKERDAQIHDTK